MSIVNIKKKLMTFFVVSEVKKYYTFHDFEKSHEKILKIYATKSINERNWFEFFCPLEINAEIL